MPAAAYTYEMIWWCAVLGGVIIPLYLSQWLALRFTPPKKRLALKVSMLSLASVCVVALAVRCSDPSAVFGRMSVSTNSLFAAQSSAMLILCASNWLVANARSLYVQINEPMPKFIAPLLYGSGVVFELTHSIILLVQGQFISHPESHSAWSVIRLTIVLDLVLDVEVLILLVVTWVLYVPLRGRIASFVAKLAMQEEARVKHLAQLAQSASTAATNVPAAVMSPLARLAVAPDVSVSSAHLPPQQQHRGGPEITQPLVVQIAVLASPSSAAAGDTPARCATPTLPPALSPAHGHGLRSNPLSNATVHPTPSPSPSLSPVNVAVSTQPAPVGASAGVGVGVGGSAAQDRLLYLRQGMRKLVIMTVLVSVVCVGTGANTYTRLSQTLHGKITSADIDGPDPESFSTGRLIPMMLHLLGIVVAVWYVWTPPAIWASAQVRRDRNTPFWHTLCHGPPTEALSRYHPETRKTNPMREIGGGGAGGCGNAAGPEPSAAHAISKQSKRNSGDGMPFATAPKQAW